MREKIYNILKLLLCFILFFYISDGINLILKLFGVDVNLLSSKALVIYQLVLSLIMFIAMLIIYRKNIIKDYLGFKKNSSKNITFIVKMFIIFMIVKYIVGFISVLIMTLLKFDTSAMTSVNQSLIETYVKAAPFLMVVSTAFLAPFYEEIIFRMGFKKILKNKYLFVILSGTLFGLLHIFPLEDGVTMVMGLMQSITYVTMGMFLSYSYYKTGNIFTSIGIHFLNNLLSILSMINLL